VEATGTESLRSDRKELQARDVSAAVSLPNILIALHCWWSAEERRKLHDHVARDHYRFFHQQVILVKYSHQV
jgi:hypothetical protein